MIRITKQAWSLGGKLRGYHHNVVKNMMVPIKELQVARMRVMFLKP
jgi:hypothetical protein